MTVRIKRVYDPPAAEDGARVLVDRLWPRGLTKQAAALELWLKDVAPSTELRQWYHAHLSMWVEFRKRYLRELGSEAGHAALQKLHDLALAKGEVTLLYAVKDIERNHAIILQQVIEGQKKPPTGTGPARAKAGRIRVARSR